MGWLAFKDILKQAGVIFKHQTLHNPILHFIIIRQWVIKDTSSMCADVIPLKKKEAEKRKHVKAQP